MWTYLRCGPYLLVNYIPHYCILRWDFHACIVIEQHTLTLLYLHVVPIFDEPLQKSDTYGSSELCKIVVALYCFSFQELTYFGASYMYANAQDRISLSAYYSKFVKIINLSYKVKHQAFVYLLFCYSFISIFTKWALCTRWTRQ